MLRAIVWLRFASQAGTWEERGYLAWAKEQLNTRLVGVTDRGVTITEMKSCTGEVRTKMK
eukprot:4879005-Pyramimonas_sp.AAC.3